MELRLVVFVFLIFFLDGFVFFDHLLVFFLDPAVELDNEFVVVVVEAVLLQVIEVESLHGLFGLVAFGYRPRVLVIVLVAVLLITAHLLVLLNDLRLDNFGVVLDVEQVILDHGLPELFAHRLVKIAEMRLERPVCQNALNCDPLFLVKLKHGLQQHQRLPAEVLFVSETGFELYPDLLDRIRGKWGLPVQYLVHQHAQAPHVDLLAVAPVAHDLGAHVLVGPADGLLPLLLLQPARPPEVAKLDVEVGVENDVLGFDVAVDDVFRVDVLDGLGGLEDEPQR